jgi:chemotaxis protein MotB
MKTIKIISVLFLAAGLTSCVSSKKYKDAVTSRDLQIEKLNDEKASLQNEKSQLELTAARTNEDNQKALQDKERALSEEQRKMEEMKALVDAERNAISNLKKEVCSALKCFTPDELSIEVREGKLYVSLSDKLLFPSGSDAVNARGKEAIAMLAAVLANSDLEIMVEGHTDNVPISTSRNKDNWDLSAHRATSVTRLMVENGIPPQRLISSGRGEFHPLQDNSTAEGKQANRRTEIVLAPKLDKLWKLTEEPAATSVN